jgi:hypothetical protein
VSQRRTVRTLAATAVLLGAVVSACTDDAAAPKPLSSPSSSADPSPSGSGSPSVGPTASATPRPPAMPGEARGTSDKAAEAFARHYVALVNYALHSGDTSPLRLSAMRSCSGCIVVTKAIADVYRRSGRIVGGDWTIQGTQTVTTKPEGPMTVRMQLHIDRQAVYNRSGDLPKLSKAVNGHLEFEVYRGSDVWVVQRLDALE